EPLVRRIARQAASFFGGELDPRFEQQLRAAQRDVLLSRVVVLVWISVVVMPSTIWTYVFFVAPERLIDAVWIVLGAVAAVLVLRALVVRRVFDGQAQLAMLLLVGGVFGPTGAAIVEITRSAPGDFFFAFFMIYFAFTSLFPADVRWIVATSAAITASYVGARAFRPEGL